MKKWKMLLVFSLSLIGLAWPTMADAKIIATNEESKRIQDALWAFDDSGVLTFENGIIPKLASSNRWENLSGIKEIVIKDNVAAPEDSSELFAFCGDFKQLEKLDVSNVTNMKGMFYSATLGSTELPDLSSWDTSKVTNMSMMFRASWLPEELQSASLHIENWDTSKVTDMSGMFMASSISLLDLNNWDTSKVTDMSYMFFLLLSNSSTSTTLDLSNWQTSKLENMENMFAASHITSLNVHGWDTTNVTNMSFTFYSAQLLTELDLSSWNTAQVTTIRELFSNSRQLKKLNISSFDTACVLKADEGQNIFYGLEQIEQITLGSKAIFSRFETGLNTELATPSGRPYWEGQRTKAFYSSGEALMRAYDGSQPDTYIRVSEQSPAENLADAEISLLKSPRILCFVDVETEAQIRFADVTLNGREQEVSEKSGAQAKISVLDTRSDKSKGWDVTVNYQDDNFYDSGLSMSLTPSASLGNTQTVTLAKSPQVFFSRGTAATEENFQALLTPKLTISSLTVQTGEIRTGLNWTLVPEV